MVLNMMMMMMIITMTIYGSTKHSKGHSEYRYIKISIVCLPYIWDIGWENWTWMMTTYVLKEFVLFWHN